MTNVALLDDPQVLPFAPILWLAWADGDLSNDERALIADQLKDAPWLRPEARRRIGAWLDPSAPPSAVALAALRTLIEKARSSLGQSQRSSLLLLGQAMAGSGTTDESKRAATELIDLLGWGAKDAAAVPAFTAIEVPTAALQRALDGDRPEVRAQVRAFLDDPERRMYGLSKAEQRAKVRGWLKDLADSGLTKLSFPGVTSDTPDLRSFMTAFETLALGDLSLVVKAGVQLGLFGGSLYFLGTDRHRALLHDVASLKMLGCFAMSEVGHGSNVAELETVARYDHETRELVLHTPRESARKDWIGGAAVDARFATVFTQLEVDGQSHGVHAVLVRIRHDDGSPTRGIRLGDCGLKMGLNGVDNGRIWFDQVRVPVANLLDRFAQIDTDGRYQSPIESSSRRFFTMLGTLVGGRVSVGSAGVSVAKSALAIALRYSTERRQFGPEGGAEIPLLRYPTHQRRLLPALASTYVLSFAFERMRRHFAEVNTQPDADTRELEAEAAGLKAIATWHATRTVQLCREACGGQGYLAVNRFPDLRADSDVFSTFEGDNTVLLQLVGKSVISRFSKSLASGGVRAVLRMIGKLAAQQVLAKNPLEIRKDDPEHLRSRAFHLATLKYREESLVRTVALRMKKRLDAKMDPQEALLEIQEHLVAAAIAWVDHLVLRSFEEEVAKVSDPEAKRWLTRLGDLHALARIEETAAWYLEDGSFAPEKARGVRKEVQIAMRELAPAATGLVAAFGIPDACLAAPIAFFDPAHPP